MLLYHAASGDADTQQRGYISGFGDSYWKKNEKKIRLINWGNSFFLNSRIFRDFLRSSEASSESRREIVHIENMLNHR